MQQPSACLLSQAAVQLQQLLLKLLALVCLCRNERTRRQRAFGCAGSVIKDRYQDDQLFRGGEVSHNRCWLQAACAGPWLA